MEDLQKYIEDRRNQNHLNFDMDECLLYINTKYTTSDANMYKRFFYYVRENVYNNFGTDIENNLYELKIRGKFDTPFFEFEQEEQYIKWLRVRKEFYSKNTELNCVRMLNFLELSLMNFITDLTTLQEYELISPNGIVTKFKKIGYGTDQDTKSFIKYLGHKFKQGFTFKAL